MFRVYLPAAFRCLVILAILLGASFAHAADKWLSIRSKNFLLVGNASESQIRRVGRNLEQFRTAFATLFPAVNKESTTGITVIVFKDDSSFRPFKPLYEGKPANVAGIFQSGNDVNFIALTADQQSPHVIFHEYVHSLTKDATRPLPPWASEGLAEFYAMFEVLSNGKQMNIGKPIGEHIVALRQYPLLPLEMLFTVDHDSPHYNEKTKQGIFYAESWALVHYLMIGNEGRRRPQLAKYLSLIDAGRSIDETFREAFQGDYVSLEKEVSDYVRNRITWPFLIFKSQNELEFDRDMQVSALSDAQAQYYLGNLMLHIDRLDTAEAQLQKAISLDSKFGPSYASMGMLRVRQKRYEDALKFLTQAVQFDSQNHMTHFYYADMLQEVQEEQGSDRRKAQLQLMRTHLKKSIELAPRFLQAYGMLGYVSLMLRDELAETEAVLKRGVSMAPGRQELLLTLCHVMVLNNEPLAARVLLLPLRNSAEDRVRIQAEELLRYIVAQVENEQAMREYEERKKTAEAAMTRELSSVRETRAGKETSSDEPPKIARKEAQSEPQTGSVIETAKPQLRRMAGLEVKGFLTMMECSKGLTLRVRVGNGTVELHSDSPSKIEFTSFVSGVTDTIPCGPLKPELPVVIIYKRASDPRFLGEPLQVNFVDKN